MNFRDLQSAIELLKRDPRVHPNTRVELAYHVPISENEDDDAARSYGESAPLISVSVDRACIILSTEDSDLAIAR